MSVTDGSYHLPPSTGQHSNNNSINAMKCNPSTQLHSQLTPCSHPPSSISTGRILAGGQLTIHCLPASLSHPADGAQVPAARLGSSWAPADQIFSNSMISLIEPLVVRCEDVMTTKETGPIIRPNYTKLYSSLPSTSDGWETRQGDVALLVNVLVLVQVLQDISQMITISERI